MQHSPSDGIKELVDGLPAFDMHRRGRRFIMEGQLERLINRAQKHAYYVYLFSDVIIYAQKKKKGSHKYVAHKYLVNCLFVDYADSSKILRYAFEIKHTEKTLDAPQDKEEYIFLAKDLHHKNEWKKNIEYHINLAIDEEGVVTEAHGSPSRGYGEAYVSGFSDPSISSGVSSFGSSDSLGSPTNDYNGSDTPSPRDGSIPSTSPESSSICSAPETWSVSSADNFSETEDETSFEELNELEISGSADQDGQPQTIPGEDGSIVVRAAPVAFLTWYLVYGDLSDISLIQSFLFKYKAFVNPNILFDILMDIYSKNNPPKDLPIKYSNYDTRRKVSSFLHIWLSRFYFQDFDNKELYNRVLDFINDVCKAGQIADANLIKIAILRVNKDRVLKRIDRRKRINPLSCRTVTLDIIKPVGLPTSPPLMWNKTDIGNRFLEFNLTSVAEHLTQVEHSLFQQISLSELVSQGWVEGKNKKHAPNIILAISKFNTLSQWVATEIVTGNNPKQRAMMIERFVSLAHKCLEMRNYSTMLGILGGISRSSVNRLKKTWNLVSSSTMETFQTLNEMMDNRQNYKNYREALRKSPKPTLPYFGVYLRDIVFIEDGNENKIGEKMNFEKVQLLAKVFKEILQFQRYKYPVCEDEEITAFFKQLCVMPEEVLYQQSRQIEPNQSGGEM